MTTLLHPLLANVAWHSLTGAQAHAGVGGAHARRYAPGYSAIMGFADPSQADFAALQAHCAVGERVYCTGVTGPPSAGWALVGEGLLRKMVWEAPLPAEEPVAQGELALQRLGAEHLLQILALVELTQPGPFGPRTIELGDYFGCFEGERLVAMAGERMHAPPLREVSGVCTHPDARGHGLARRLMLHLVRREMHRGETPFLHVMSANIAAHALYLRMGFVDRLEVPVRVVSRSA